MASIWNSRKETDAVQTVSLKRVAKSIVRGMASKSPEILVGLGIVGGVVVTPILAVRATPKAIELLEQKKDELDTDRLTMAETVKTAWKPYVPAMVTGAISVGCIVLSSRENHRRNAALAAAYSLSEAALKDYQSKTMEVVGEKKVTEIQDKIAQDKVNKTDSNTIIITDRGKTLCYEPITNTLFESDIESVKRVINDLNFKMRRENYITLDDYLLALHLKPSEYIGREMGWHVDCGAIDPKFTTTLTQDGRPCLVIGFYNGSEPIHLDTYLGYGRY